MIPIKVETLDCVWCCFGCASEETNPQAQVYINSDGIAERFDPYKAIDDGRALRLAMRNLNKVIIDNATLANRNVVDVLDQIVEAVGVPLNNEDPIPLTIDLVQKINLAIYNILERDVKD